jgi:KDO2-lipid IV(A) lauroyltransferase
MQYFVFILVYPFIWLLSKLPMKILYLISDFFFVLVYHIIGYRKEVVVNNLKLAFPEKSEKEMKTISKKFFSYLCDFFMESLKTFTISEKEILKRMKYKNLDVLEKILAKNKSIALVGAHQANWEWMTGLPLHLKNYKVSGAYTKVANKFFEDIIKKSRSKFGGFMYRSTHTIVNVHRDFKNETKGLYMLLSDQSPQVSKTFYWSEFMGIRVPIHVGAEMLAKKYDMAYVTFSSKRLKRGYYEIEFNLVTENPKEFEDYKLTDQFLRNSEAQIRQNPEVYLWSHKRFKHRGKEHKSPVAK